MANDYVILCIDDEEIVLESLSMELNGKFPGVELELLQDNAEAEELVLALQSAGSEIAVVVCDYIMPGRRGDAVLASLHRLAPAARTVMLTGQSSMEGVTNAINQANLYRYIAKPWGKDDIVLTLRSALESYIQEETIKRQNRVLKELNESLEQKVVERTRELRAANEELTQANRKISESLDIIDRHVLVSRIDKNGVVTYVSQAFCKRSGYSRFELIGRNYWHTLYSSITDTEMRGILTSVEAGQVWEGEMQHQCRSGEYYWTHEIVSPILGDESVILGFTTIRQDITDKKAVEEISITDALTGLYNRRHFNLVLDKEISRARRHNQVLALGIIDVDHFKRYNDHYGHVAGDAVLQALGSLLADTFKRGCDYAFRIGGEEFALLVTVRGEAEAHKIAAELIDAVATLDIDHEYNDASPYVSISLGMIVITPEHPNPSPESLYRAADTLLYRAKSEGRNRYVL